MMKFFLTLALYHSLYSLSISLRMDSDYNYLTTIALADSGTPSLALEASTNVPFSRGNNTTFDTSQLALNVQTSLDSQEIPSRDLMGSALIREIKDWLSKVPFFSSLSPSLEHLWLTSAPR